MTAKEVLNGIKDSNVFLKYVQTLEPQIGSLGGRRFYNEKKEGGSVCINDVVLRLNELYPTLPKAMETQKDVNSIITIIHSKNKAATELLDKLDRRNSTSDQKLD